MADLDFTRQLRAQHKLPYADIEYDEQKEWTSLVEIGPTYVFFSCAPPLTDREVHEAKEHGLFGIDGDPAPANSDRLTLRVTKNFDGNQDHVLTMIPEMELALQAMLACSISDKHALVSSYWRERMSIFDQCVAEIKVSTCPEILAFRQWTESHVEHKPIYLIPTGDVNHTRARFEAYPRVWDVFATIFGDTYRGRDSFYYAHPNVPPESEPEPEPEAEDVPVEAPPPHTRSMVEEAFAESYTESEEFSSI